MGEAGQARWKTSSTSIVSGTVTSWPACSSRSHRCEPRKPEPPVTRIRRRDMSASWIHGDARFCKTRLENQALPAVTAATAPVDISRRPQPGHDAQPVLRFLFKEG